MCYNGAFHYPSNFFAVSEDSENYDYPSQDARLDPGGASGRGLHLRLPEGRAGFCQTTVVFGGMLASTILAIPFVPVFYVIMEGLSERRAQRKKAAPQAVRPEEPTATMDRH